MPPSSHASFAATAAISGSVPICDHRPSDIVTRNSELAIQHFGDSDWSRRWTQVVATESDNPPPVPKKDTPNHSLPYSPTSQVGPREAQEPERPRPDATLIEDDIDRLLTMFNNPEPMMVVKTTISMHCCGLLFQKPE
jgi:hypothetical protein